MRRSPESLRRAAGHELTDLAHVLVMFERAGGWCVQGEERETLVVGEVAGYAECSARRVHAGRVALANEVEGRLSCPPAPAVWASATADVLAAAAQVALPCAQLLQQGLPPRLHLV